jgi:hypothetical protein
VFALLAWQAVKLDHRKNDAIRETNEAIKQLEELQSSAENLRANLAELLKAREATIQALGVARTSLRGNDNAVRELNTALRTIETVGGGQWVVIGGDKSLAEAQVKVQKAQKLGYANIAIYLRQNSYRTVIQFSSEPEAKAELSKIHTLLSADAYLRDLHKWCPHQQERGGYFSCPD